MKNKHLAGIYVHIPFCMQKCAYCDFYSIVTNSPQIREEYTASIVKELQMLAPLYKERSFVSIYLGGGTPSLLSAHQVERIVNEIVRSYQITKDIEISMEANPATLSLLQLQELKQAGINRISLGVQSFNKSELNTLGRVHDVNQVWKTIDMFKKAGIDNFNLDLIYGIPGQSMDSWMKSLQMAVKSEAKHISAYLLQLESHTPLAKRISRGELAMLDEDLEAEMYYIMLEYLKEEGLKQYEISNFARAGYECRHNILYWKAREYLGIGAGAVSFMDGKRSINLASIDKYIQANKNSKLPETDILEDMDDSEKVIDAIIMGLRMTEGIKQQEFLERFAVDIMEQYKEKIERCIDMGLLECKKGSVSLSSKGYFLSNEVFRSFIS